MIRSRLTIPFAILFLVLAGCSASKQARLRLATTTSVQDSGLMPYLLPHFEKECDCTVDVIAVGTGQALKLAENTERLKETGAIG